MSFSQHALRHYNPVFCHPMKDLAKKLSKTLRKTSLEPFLTGLSYLMYLGKVANDLAV